MVTVDPYATPLHLNLRHLDNNRRPSRAYEWKVRGCFYHKKDLPMASARIEVAFDYAAYDQLVFDPPALILRLRGKPVL